MLEIFQAAFFFLKLLWFRKTFVPQYVFLYALLLHPVPQLNSPVSIYQYTNTNVCTTWSACHTGNCFGGGGGGGGGRYSRWFEEQKS